LTTPSTSPSAGGPGTSLAELVFPDQLNHHGTYFGGAALSLMSRAAFVAASRVARSDVVIARCNEVEFDRPVFVGELVEGTAAVERVGNWPMTVAVDVTAEELLTGERRAVATGRFEMVALAAGDAGRSSAEAP
jgi:acyl-CoA hydrolase